MKKFNLFLLVLIVFLFSASGVSSQDIFGGTLEENLFGTDNNSNWHPPMLPPETVTPGPLSPDGGAYGQWLEDNPLPGPFDNQSIIEPGGPGGVNYPISSGGGGGNTQTIAGILNLIVNQILNPLIGVLISLALVIFFIGVIKYIRVAGEEDKNDAKKIMWWGIIALFVMISVWGLVQILINTFFPGGVPPTPPIPRF